VLAEHQPDPVPQTAIIDAFSRHVKAELLRSVLSSLEADGKIRSVRIPTAGRPATAWTLAR
jgi:predicted ArsR family transcriptional regulator